MKSSGESYKNDTAPVHPYFAKNVHASHDHDNTNNH
jgi:hypothetical protein